jgi:hypothetical protein
MSLASALVLRGMPRQASGAIKTAIRDLQGVPAARAHVQHAAILQELGHDDAALAEIRQALPMLRRAGDAEWEARALSNRSLMHIARRAFSAAEADLFAARRLCIENNLDLPAGYAEQNLGCVKAQQGDVPASLRHFDAAAELYLRFDVVEPSLLLDRARVLLSVRLLGEARESAESAVAVCRQQKRDVHLPEAQLMLSTVALLQEDKTAALASAAEAVRRFRKLGHAHSLALAHYAWIQASLSADSAAVGHGRVARVADELEAAGWRVPALEARVLAARVAMESGRRIAARHHLELASKARFVGPADARARAWLAEAMLRRTDGRRRAASAALRAGLRIVEEFQATLGATELRAHVSVHRGAIASAGLRMALEDASPRAALWWAERGRAISLLLPSAEPSDDPELAHDLADLRSTMAEIEEARAAPPFDDRLLIRRQVALERRIRDRSRTLEKSGNVSRERTVVSELVSAFSDATLLEFIEVNNERHAITVARGRVRIHPAGGRAEVQDLLKRVPFALRRLARHPTTWTQQGDGAMQMLRRAAATLDDLLLRPLSAEIGDRPLVIVPSSDLYSVPWSILESCAGRPTTVSPSANVWLQAVDRKPAPDQKAVVVAGPGLPGAAAEASTIASLYPKSTFLQGDQATTSALTNSLEGASMLHLAAHGRLRADNPLFSSLRLADGPMTIYELERLPLLPDHIVLAACDTGRQIAAGGEVLGFGAAMLAAGATTLVAPVVPVQDLATVPLMRSYHERLLAQRSPAEALAEAQAAVDPADPAGIAAAASFVCLGAG